MGDDVDDDERDDGAVTSRETRSRRKIRRSTVTLGEA